MGLWTAVRGLAVACGSVAGGIQEPVRRPFDTVGVTLSACGLLLLLSFGSVESSDVGWHSPVVAVSPPAPLRGQARPERQPSRRSGARRAFSLPFALTQRDALSPCIRSRNRAGD
jgi:hypothetical protein